MVIVPRFAELSAKRIYQIAMGNPEIRMYLPEPISSDSSDAIGVNKDFLYNIVNTLDEEFFQKNISEAYRKRKEQEMERKQQSLSITSYMLDLIRSSNIKSSSNQKSIYQCS